MTKFLLLLGPSGTGKSTIIHELKRLDNRFVYISPFITRPLRKGEEDKTSVSDSIMDEMTKRGEFLVVNNLYGIRYATPKMTITNAFQEGRFPVLDWPISKLGIMTDAFPNKLFSVYVEPPSLDELRERLNRDGRDLDGHRFSEAVTELKSLWAGEFNGKYDLKIVNQFGEIDGVSRKIYNSYTESIGEGNRRSKESE